MCGDFIRMWGNTQVGGFLGKFFWLCFMADGGSWVLKPMGVVESVNILLTLIILGHFCVRNGYIG
jgi:hypothetical protein